jgi:hypothetical protein
MFSFLLFRHRFQFRGGPPPYRGNHPTGESVIKLAIPFDSTKVQVEKLLANLTGLENRMCAAVLEIQGVWDGNEADLFCDDSWKSGKAKNHPHLKQGTIIGVKQEWSTVTTD